MWALSCILLQLRRINFIPVLSFQPSAAVANEVKVCYALDLKSLNHIMIDALTMPVVLLVSEISAKRTANSSAGLRGLR